MKNFKRVLAVVLCVLMILPMSVVSSFAAQGDPINANWTTFGTKYGGSTPHKQANTGFSFTEAANGGIFANIPTSDEYAVGAIGTVAIRNAKAANYPVTAMTYAEPVSLDGITATVNFNENCTFSETNGSTFSFLLTDKKPVGINAADLTTGAADAQTSMVRNGFRGFVSEGTKGLMVTIGNGYTPYTETQKASWVNIYYFDGSFIDQQDGAYGYRWSFTARNMEGETPNADNSQIKQHVERIDFTDGLTFAVRADDTLGYIVSVNGQDYCLGEKVAYFPSNNKFDSTRADADFSDPAWAESMTGQKKDIDLTGLVGTDCYLTIGSIGNNTKNDENEYTVTSINGVPANAWAGESASVHTHTPVALSEEWTACTLPSYVKTQCSTCGAILGVVEKEAQGHKYETTSETFANCTDDGVLTQECSVCRDVAEKITAKWGHKWSAYELTTPATVTDAGERTRTCATCKTVETQTIPAIGSGTYSDYWTVSNYDNRTVAIGWDPATPVFFPSVTANGALSLIDYAKQNNIENWSGIVLNKAISNFATKLDGFSATVTPLAYTQTYSDKTVETLSFVWTTEPNQYDEVSEYSVFKGGISTDNMQKMRFGYMNADPVGGEYSVIITLMDYCVVAGTPVSSYGTAGDGIFDVAVYTIFSNGNYYNTKLDIVNIPATSAIDVSMSYAPDDTNTFALIANFNGTNFYMPVANNSQLCQDVYYFGVAAYTDGVLNSAYQGASFEINSVCEQQGAYFNGNTAVAEPCAHTYKDITIKAATCNATGTVSHYCTLCGYEYRETTPVDETLHVPVIDEGRAATCAKKGKTEGSHCSVCGKVLVAQESIDKLPHTWGEWVEYPEQGIKVRNCTKCTASESEQLACVHDYQHVSYDASDFKTVKETLTCSKCKDTKVETIISTDSDNFNVVIKGAKPSVIRFAYGSYTTSSAIRNAQGMVTYSQSNINSMTKADGSVYVPANKEGTYSFWMRTSIGEFVLQATLSKFTPDFEVSVSHLVFSNVYSGISNLYIGTGIRTTYRDIKNNLVTSASYSKLSEYKNFDLYHKYVYRLDSKYFDNNGEADITICYRFNDGTPDLIITRHLSITVPSVTQDGLNLNVSGLTGVKCVKRAFGTYTTIAAMKAASGLITLGGSMFGGLDEGVVHIPYEGALSLMVQYKNGYTKVFNLTIVQKRPTFVQDGNKVTIGNLDDLYIVRYAKGTYAKPNAIKAAVGSQVIRPTAIDPLTGTIVVENLSAGKYTFLVQYTDESINIYNITVN